MWKNRKIQCSYVSRKSEKLVSHVAKKFRIDTHSNQLVYREILRKHRKNAFHTVCMQGG